MTLLSRVDDSIIQDDNSDNTVFFVPTQKSVASLAQNTHGLEDEDIATEKQSKRTMINVKTCVEFSKEQQQ